MYIKANLFEHVLKIILHFGHKCKYKKLPVEHCKTSQLFLYN